MTNREKAELCDLARRCATCCVRNGMSKFGCKIENCDDEYNKNLDWLMEDYEEEQEEQPQVDWSKVPVDTLIEVSTDKKDWQKKYFARYDNGKVFAWNGGTTSKTVKTVFNESCASWWGYARLLEE